MKPTAVSDPSHPRSNLLFLVQHLSDIFSHGLSNFGRLAIMISLDATQKNNRKSSMIPLIVTSLLHINTQMTYLLKSRKFYLPFLFSLTSTVLFTVKRTGYISMKPLRLTFPPSEMIPLMIQTLTLTHYLLCPHTLSSTNSFTGFFLLPRKNLLEYLHQYSPSAHSFQSYSTSCLSLPLPYLVSTI